LFVHFEKCVFKLIRLSSSSSNNNKNKNNNTIISRSSFLFSLALLFIHNSLPVKKKKAEESQNVTAISYIVSA